MTEQLSAKFSSFRTAVEALLELEPHLPALKKAIPVMLEKDHPERAEALRYYQESSPVFIRAIRSTYLIASRSGNVFHELLQSYDFEPGLRKRLEQASKSYTRGNLVAPKPKEVAAVYEKAVSTYRLHLAWYQEALSSGVGKVPLKIGSFQIVNTGGFGLDRLDGVRSVLEQAEQRLSKKGLHKVCYGEVYLSNDVLHPNTIAFYVPKKDQLFFRGDLKYAVEGQVKTVIHELAHRLHRKFLRHRNHEIETLYHWVGKGSREGGPPFITSYAKTSPAENFAEMVAYWCFDALPSSQENLLLPLVVP